MKKFSFLVLLVLSVFATNVFAEGEVNVWSGYTRLDDLAKFDKFHDSLLEKRDVDDDDEFEDKDVKVKGKLANAFTYSRCGLFFWQWRKCETWFSSGLLTIR
ncbi:hypothetical protein AGMMS49592_0190 [Endomicrobiia bacterium]|nr:hypothetical protein AGMMS49592_0190 [Endomicrobiia bacterium]